MPKLIDFPIVTQRMDQERLVSLYPNSGAFGFAPGVATHATGWIGEEDASILPAARALCSRVAAPVVPSLVELTGQAWRDTLPGVVWLSPKAHWAYELDFGSGVWMPDLLRRAGVDPDLLSPRHDGTAIEFSPPEFASLALLMTGLLENLLGSDFQLTFPGRDTICTVHHHKQLWWTSTNAAVIETLRAMPITPHR